MSKTKTGRVLLTVAVALTGIISTIVDLIPGDEGHMGNTHWLPHAKFHDAAMFLLLDGMCIMALWLMWRKSKEPKVGMTSGLALVCIFWSAFYYITTLFPDASLLAGTGTVPLHMDNIAIWPAPQKNMTPILFGFFPVYMNVAIGTVLMIVALIGTWFYKKGLKIGDMDSRLKL